MLANFKFEKENTGIKANKTLEQPNLKNVQNPEQGYRNFEIQIGPLDRWCHQRHTNIEFDNPK